MFSKKWNQFRKSVWFKRVAALVVLVIVFAAGNWWSNRPTPYYPSTGGYGDYGPEEEMAYGVKSLSYAPEPAYYDEGQATTAADYFSDSQSNDGEAAEDLDMEQKIIKTGSLTIDVKSTENTINAITSLASGYGGFVQSSETWLQSDETTAGYVTFKVDAQYFEEAVQGVKDLATVIQSESISGQDVTEEYVDLQARLGNLYAEEEQYLEIMGQATTVEELLMVSDYLASVREDIEVIEGRLKYLDSRTDYSTISVWIYEEASVIAPTSDWQPIVVVKESINTLVESLQGVVDTVIAVVIVGGPYVILAFLLYWIIAKIARRKKHK